jgi:hypothetical protein
MWTRHILTSHIAFFVTNTDASSARMLHLLTRRAALSSLAFYGRLFSPVAQVRMVPPRNTITQQHMSFFVGHAKGGILHIDHAAMAEIIKDVANSSHEESGYVIINVHGHDEIQTTGKLNDVVVTLPLPYIAQGVLAMDKEDFKETFEFEKPQLDETLVFSCKAGIQSQQAGQLAKMQDIPIFLTIWVGPMNGFHNLKFK